MTAAAVTVGVVFVFIWHHVLRRGSKGSAPGRLVAVLLAGIIFWMFVAVKNPAAGAKAVAFTATGTAGLIAGIGHFITAL
jgi:hypothetical protein